MSGVEIAGHLPDGRAVERITIAGHGLTVKLLTLGATVQSIHLDQIQHSLIVGFETLEPYLTVGGTIGPVVGRVANRITNGIAEIGGQPCQFDRNENGRNTLHGGTEGTAKQLWTLTDTGPSHATLGLTLPDGHMGFPGALTIKAHFRVVAPAGLEIDIHSETDAPTLCNLAPHLYFNLDGGGDARNQVMQIAAEHVLPTDANKLPTGEIMPVEGSPWDFRNSRTLQGNSGGYDHNLCLADSRRSLMLVGTLRGARSGVSMAIRTTEPGLQVYDGSGLGPRAGGPYAGVALEPQVWPDAPNHAGFPSIALGPGDALHQITRLDFTANPPVPIKGS